MKREKGFTLIELMTAIGIGAILVTIAVPSMQSVAMNSKQRSSANELLSAMHLARNTAITTNSRVTMCPSESGRDCDGGQWHDGFIAFIDLNSNQAVDDDERIVRSSPGFADLSMESSEFGNFLMYRPNGRVIAASATSSVGSFTVCDERGEDHARVINIELSGRPQVIDPYDGGVTVSCS